MQASRKLDVRFAAALVAIGVLEVVVNRLEYDPTTALAGIGVAAAAMLLRSRLPLVCLGLFVTLIVALQLPGMGDGLTAAVMIGFLLVIGTVGRCVADPAGVLALAAALIVLSAASAVTSRPWDPVIALIGCVTAWGVGRLMRREAQRSTELSALAAELVTERDARAQEAVSAERARIARELHDAVAHTVSVMTVRAAGVRRSLDSDAGRIRERDGLLDVERLGREAVAELHRTVGLLHSGPQADDVPLAPLPRLDDLDRLAARVCAAGVPVTVRVEGASRPLPPGVDLTAYRVVQEALTNTLKHAGPAAVDVLLCYGETALAITVTDNGHGPDSTDADGHGLSGMRERAALYGGTVHAGPERGGGFIVRVSLPIASGAGG